MFFVDVVAAVDSVALVLAIVVVVAFVVALAVVVALTVVIGIKREIDQVFQRENLRCQRRRRLPFIFLCLPPFLSPPLFLLALSSCYFDAKRLVQTQSGKQHMYVCINEHMYVCMCT